MRKHPHALLFIAALLICNVCPAQQQAGADTFLTAPFLQKLQTDGITISWELADQADCEVEFGLDAQYGQKQPCTMTVGPRDRNGGGGTCIYLCKLTGLKPGTTYHYRAVVAGNPGDDQTFRTAPTEKEDFTFAVWGDSQAPSMVNGKNQPLTDMIAHMKLSAVNFAVALGDMSPNGRFYNDVRACVLDLVCKDLGRTVPFMITWGNHDGKPSELIRQYLPAYSKTYSFDYAGCHLLCIDMNHRDYKFIESDLKAAQAAGARHIFVFMHHPPSDRSEDAICKSYQKDLVPLMTRYGVAGCFCGHWHRYDHFERDGIRYYITGGGLMEARPSPHYLQVHVDAKGWTVTKHDFFAKGEK